MRSQYPHVPPASPTPYPLHASAARNRPTPSLRHQTPPTLQSVQAYQVATPLAYQKRRRAEPTRPRSAAPQHPDVRSENWKLMSIVVFFLFWMCAGIFFLGLYMDKYLF